MSTQTRPVTSAEFQAGIGNLAGAVRGAEHAAIEARQSAAEVDEARNDARAQLYHAAGALGLTQGTHIDIEQGTATSEVRCSREILVGGLFTAPPYFADSQVPLDGRRGSIFRYEITDDGRILAMIDTEARTRRERFARLFRLVPQTGSYWLDLSSADTRFTLTPKDR